MKVSLNWIKKYVDLTDITPEEIASKLTMAGIEVESIDPLAVGTNLVTAFVKEAKLMENSDHLSLCQVELGSKYGSVQIVCGAPNIKTGQKVIVARPGAKLKEVSIGRSSIRGHESNGMICSLLELGVDSKQLSQDSIEGIEVLDSATAIGREDVLALLGLDDVILSIKLLANRPDAMGLYNVAREIAMLFNRQIKPWTQALPIGNKPNFKVDVRTGKCPQFTIRTVMGIGRGITPEYIAQALKAMGMRTISPLVDISNYVMLLTGQPLHFYDLDRLEEPRLVISDDINAPFYALDGKEYQAQAGDITISSGTTIACLAGVMGSNRTGVDESTRNIAIEAANFHGASIRQTSIRLSLPSESSARFIKGINPHQAEDVLDLTIYLIKEILGCDTYSSSIAHDTIIHELKRISFTSEAINQKLGTHFSADVIKTTLEKDGFGIEKNGSLMEAIVPAYRIDVEGLADLAEEVIRINGFEHIDVRLPSLKALHAGRTAKQVKIENIRHLLRGAHLDETISYTLLHLGEINRFRFLNDDELYRVGNPMTDEHEYVRGSLLYSMLKVANYNVARQNKDVAIFEISSIETKKRRTMNLGIVLVGDRYYRRRLSSKQYDFYDIKGLLEAIFNQLGIDGGRYRLERLDDRSEEMHPGQSARLFVDNRFIGVLGVLSPEARDQFDFKRAPVIMMEVDLGALLDVRVSPTKMNLLSKFPFVTRDIAVIIGDQIDSQSLIKAIRKTNKELIRDVEIFDVYQGDHVADGHKSIAFSITIGSDKKTLTDLEVGEVIERIKMSLAQSFDASFRI